MKHFTSILSIGLILFFGTTGILHAKSNEGKVQSELREKYDKVILGKKIDHKEYLKFLASLTGGLAGVTTYLGTLATDIVRETGQQVAQETIYDLIRGKHENTLVSGKPVYVGIATYNRWTDENWFGVKWKKPEPNTHQFYIAIGNKRPRSEETIAFYIIQNSVLHRVDPNSGDYEKLNHDWSEATSITGLDGWLYIIQNDRLHKVNPKNGDYTLLNHIWDGRTQMTAMSGSLYITQNSVLHQVDPDTGNYRKLKHNWLGATSITNDNGFLYIIQNDRLHKVNPRTGDYTLLNHIWDGRTRITHMNGRLYVVQNKVLHDVDPTSGDYNKLKHDWSGTTAMTGFNGKIYIIQNDVLHQVNSLTGDYKKLNHDWSGSAHAATLSIRF